MVSKSRCSGWSSLSDSGTTTETRGTVHDGNGNPVSLFFESMRKKTLRRTGAFLGRRDPGDFETDWTLTPTHPHTDQ